MQGKLSLDFVQPDNYEKVIRFLMWEHTPTLMPYLNAYQHHPKLCRVVMGFNGEVYCLMYPELHNGEVVQVHAVLSHRAVLRRESQQEALREYIDAVFQNPNYIKVTISHSEEHRLIGHLAHRLGFVEEGRHRKEAAGYDMIYLGMLKEEWCHGQQKEST